MRGKEVERERTDGTLEDSGVEEVQDFQEKAKGEEVKASTGLTETLFQFKSRQDR